MLNWNGKNKCVKVIEKIEQSNIVIYETSEGWFCSDEVAAQLIIDSYTIEEYQMFLCEQVSLLAKSVRDSFINLYSPAEMSAWAIKLEEAKKYSVSKNPDDAKMLTVESTYRNCTLDEIVVKVIEKATMFSNMEAAISGIDGYHRDKIKTLNSFEELTAYNYTNGWPGV